MKIIPIDAGNFKMDGGAMFGVVPKSVWSRYYPCDENNLCNWALRSLLIDEGDRKILIDTGMGNKQDAKYFAHFHRNGEGELIKSLNEAGYNADDITDVIITHLHFDHVGGAVYRSSEGALLPTFPNAKYWINKTQWDWAIEANPREKASFFSENFLPLQEAGQVVFVEDQQEITENIKVKSYFGHTHGQIIPFIKYQNKTIVFMADLMPSTAHIPLAWMMAYDIEPMITLKEREEFYKEAINNDMILFFQHDLYNEACNLENTPKGVRVKDSGKLKDLMSI
ncbi:MAG: MBL fold metallo-hydrolase [Hyphomicrobiales bacterium]